MADIILKDGAAQEQTYAGISTIKVPQVGGDYAEFKAGGGQATGGVPILTNMARMRADPGTTWGLTTLTGSPMNITFYFDVPKTVKVIGARAQGGIYLRNPETHKGKMEGFYGTKDFTAAEKDENTTRYSFTESYSYTYGETEAVTSYGYVSYDFIYEGVSISVRDGEAVLSGSKALEFLTSSLFGVGDTQQFEVYDLRECVQTDFEWTTEFRNISGCKKAYFPAGIAKLPGGFMVMMPNLELADFSLATAVPALGGTYCFNEGKGDFQIKVPAALYDEWIAAKNWSSFASHIVAV